MIDFVLGETKEVIIKESRMNFTQKYLEKDLEEFH